MRLRERTFSEGSTTKLQSQKEMQRARRRNDSPSTYRLDYDREEDNKMMIGGHIRNPEARHYFPESDTNVRRMSPRKTRPNYET